MNKLPLLFVLTCCIFAAGCESDDFREPPPPPPRKLSKAEKARKAMRDPIADMLKIERKEHKTFVGESEILSETEQKAFKESWSSQHREAEALHDSVQEKHRRDKDKTDSWVFY